MAEKFKTGKEETWGKVSEYDSATQFRIPKENMPPELSKILKGQPIKVNVMNETVTLEKKTVQTPLQSGEQIETAINKLLEGTGWKVSISEANYKYSIQFSKA